MVEPSETVDSRGPRLRIGYLVPQFPGQTHVFFWRELKALEAMGHEVTVFSTRTPPPGLISHDWSQEAIARTTYLGKADAEAALSAFVRLLPKGLPGWMRREGMRFSKDVLITLSAAQQVLRHCREKGIDHVHAHSCGRAALIAALAQKMGGPTWSMTLHGPLSDYGSGQRFKWSNAGFATVITQKLLDEMRRDLPNDLPDRVVIRPMGVDTDALVRSQPYEPVRRGTPMRIFACGRLNIVKGHQDLMTAVRKLLDQGVDVRLEIAGEDDDGGDGYRKELQGHLKNLRLQDHVKLLGAIDGTAVRDKLLNAHVFVLASWHEPLGVAYMEAMSCEVPTIGTASGGVKELISDGDNGLLVPPRDPDALAAAIKRLSGDPDLAMRLSRVGRQHIVRNFRSSLGAETLVDEILRLKSAAE
ncbi:exopolysaccharide biosynthesis GT4 family glycosyltransferase EpsE [Mesobacterium sp. TK19101]|uniref:Exopolysaccharide biosynthesis GT4 family glycosyltransferase EpsE n=1 Tax=Mesobacterium hydrothermale TaxID=3111907 RepID=A0ABU6HHN2_9RHOB|nr:exopolysaccharide biosynthesis GT4 family glycosyltransferase EpsE [Mesobacterium sp. TK19101]MEC3861294.1 exopolysaccharide biosynthesis GT4 family glycosyltransferase EpsE [Mesobacterium sp. TK19101]